MAGFVKSFEMMSNYWAAVNGEKLDEFEKLRIKSSREFTILLCEQAVLPRKSIPKLFPFRLLSQGNASAALRSEKYGQSC